MEKIIHETRSVTIIYHDFYCDDCNKHLGRVQEYDDGYYGNLGEFEQKFYISRGWYRLRKNLCDDCKDKMISKICATLEEIGFEADEH